MLICTYSMVKLVACVIYYGLQRSTHFFLLSFAPLPWILYYIQIYMKWHTHMTARFPRVLNFKDWFGIQKKIKTLLDKIQNFFNVKLPCITGTWFNVKFYYYQIKPRNIPTSKLLLNPKQWSLLHVCKPHSFGYNFWNLYLHQHLSRS